MVHRAAGDQQTTIAGPTMGYLTNVASNFGAYF